jgi:hypothetical protein
MAGIRRARSGTRALHEIEAGLKTLTRGLRRLVLEVRSEATNGRPAKSRTVSRTLRLQGRYMGLIRTLPEAKKSRVKALRARKGVEEAIRMARGLRD